MQHRTAGRRLLTAGIVPALCLLATMSGAMSGAWAASATDACTRKPLKPDAAAWLAEDTIVNGQPVAVATVSYRQGTAEVARRYREYWNEAGVPSRALRSAKGWLITAIEDECSYVLQLPEQGGRTTTGLFSAMRLRRADLPQPVDARAMPLPAGGRVMSDVVSRDPMAVARTVVVELDGSTARRAHDQYVAGLQDGGWRVLADAQAPRIAGGGTDRVAGGYAVAMQKEGYRLDATFLPAGGRTRAVINLARTL